MKRRDFLKTTAAAALATGAPAIINAADKAGTRNPIMGSGDYRYECAHGWGQLPSHLRWETTHGVTEDSQGFIYVKQQGHPKKPAQDTIIVFDADGKYVRSFGKEYYPGGHGIDIRKEGGEEFLYLSVVWPHFLVVKTNLKGEVVWKKGVPQEPAVYATPTRSVSEGSTADKKTPNKKPPYVPTNVAFAPDGGFYIADGYGSSYIHQYDKDAKWVRTWGGFGTEPGKMKTPHGIWLDNRPGREPSLVVADRANGRLQYFTLDGKHIGFVPNLLFPCHFDIRGDLLLVADGLARLSIFDKENKPLVHMGGDDAWIAEVKNGFKVRMDEKLWQPGKFVHPHDACFDHEGNIYVAEWVHTGRMTKMKRV